MSHKRARAEREMESRKEIKRQLQLRRDIALELFSSLPYLKRCASLSLSVCVCVSCREVRAGVGAFLRSFCCAQAR